MSLPDLLAAPRKHSARKSGPKHDKKVAVDKKKRGLSNKKHNPRAFSVSNIQRTQRNIQRNLDRAQKKEVVPLVDRTEDTPPPAMIVVMGPRNCGKSTLIRSLVKVYTNQNMTDARGPITAIAGKKRRVTFFECPPDDIYAMVDLAKIADLVIILIDASFGYEMETFEFLNLLQLHGFPKVIGVLTHLDGFQQNKKLQNTRKTIKARFWAEIYKGAKLFDMTNISNGRYPKNEVKRLALHISRVKYRPLVWRNTHPFLLVDRVEDITPLSDEHRDDERTVAVYGFIRGTHLKPTMMVHLIGAGDFPMDSITQIDDPCPLAPDKSQILANTDAIRKSLRKKDSLLFAPMANIGNVSIDKDGVYIDIKKIHYTKAGNLQIGSDQRRNALQTLGVTADVEESDDTNYLAGTPAGLLRSMQDIDTGVDERLREAELSLFRGSEKLKSADVEYSDEEEEDDDEDDDDDDEGSDDNECSDDDEGSDDDDIDDEQYEEEDDDMDETDEQYNENDDEGLYSDDESKGEINTKHRGKASGTLKNTKLVPYDNQNVDAIWKSGMKSKADSAYLARSVGGPTDPMSLVYGADWRSSGKITSKLAPEKKVKELGVESESDSGDELFVAKSSKAKSNYSRNNAINSNRDKGSKELFAKWKKIFDDVKVAKNKMSLGDDEDEDGDSDSHEWSDNEDGEDGDEDDIVEYSDDGDEDDDGDEGSDDDDDEDSDDNEGDDDEYDHDDVSENGESSEFTSRKPKVDPAVALIQNFKNKFFVTGDWSSVGKMNVSKKGDDENEDGNSDDDDDLDSFNDKIDEDLRKTIADRKASAKQKFDEDYDESKIEKMGEKKKKGLEEIEEEAEVHQALVLHRVMLKQQNLGF